MAKLAKFLQGAAGNAGGAGLDITEVFSTYLFKPNTSGNFPVTNNIDLDEEGGMVWMKRRDASGINMVHDTERWGGSNGGYLRTDSNSGSASTAFFSSFNSDGFTPQDLQNQEMASWTFRKAPKFFDCVKWSGNDADADRAFSHSLDSVPGMIIIKKISNDTSYMSWYVHHRSGPSGKFGKLNATSAWDDDDGDAVYTGIFGETAPSSTQFYVSTQANQAQYQYVAYLFAHNDSGDGEFGPDGDQDIIKCGSYTGNGSTTGPVIDLGFEPQWLLVKSASSADVWMMTDNMRGMINTTNGNNNVNYLKANTSDAESGFSGKFNLTSTGFKITDGGSIINGSGNTYIYMAIRRGPLAPPEAGTEVFDAEQGGSSVDDNALGVTTGFPVDMFMHFDNYTSGGENFVVDRLRGSRAQVRTQYSNAEAFYSTNNPSLDSNTGLINRSGSTQNLSGGFYWSWKRAPSFFDVVCYKGTGTGGYGTINHNLGVIPEMVWFKNRSSNATPRGNWYVYHKDLTNSGGYLYLNGASAEATAYSGWATGTFAPTDTAFTVSKSTLHYTNENYIAYFFATLAGVSKVGMFTGNGSSLNVDCGFSSGARFVLVKALNTVGSYFLFDTVRGIVSGNDPQLSLNADYAEDTSRDLIDPLSSGFTINYHSDWGNQLNGNGYKYIFYAIA